MGKNNKLLAVRDVVLSFLMKEELTIEETKQVLQMCYSEVDAAVKRSKLAEVKKEEE